MEPFEYVMVLVSIIVGLAITHILAAFGRAVRRLRGHGPPIRIEATYLLWVGFLFTWLLSFWWWEFKFQDVIAEWSFGLYLFVVGYAIVLFAVTVLLVPGEMKGLDDSFAYLVDGRKWIFGMFLLVQAIDVVDTALKGEAWLVRPFYIVQVGAFVASALVGLTATSRRLHLPAAAVAFLTQLVYMFHEVGILGRW